MHWIRRGTVAVGIVGLLAAAGCAGGEHDDFDGEAEEAPAAGAKAGRAAPAAAKPLPPPPPISAADSAAARARIGARGDSLRAAFAGASVLRWSEVWGLRRDKNAEQIATARSLGVRASGQAEIERLVREGRLVALADSTPWWVLRKMTHSSPYMTPDGRAMLVRIGQRFHARLDSLGLPRYRMKVTSVLRTDETQAELRKINANASQTVSAHEFGTTLDVSHERFAVPAPPKLGVRGGTPAAPGATELEVEMLEEVGKEHAKVLQAELGRAITDLREEGVLHVMMEDAQPVYHMTVARRMAAGE